MYVLELYVKDRLDRLYSEAEDERRARAAVRAARAAHPKTAGRLVRTLRRIVDALRDSHRAAVAR